MEMDDHKRRRNMILYVLIAFALYLVLNQVLFPNIARQQLQINDVSYSTMISDLKNERVKDMEYTVGSDSDALYTRKGDEEGIAYQTTVLPGAESYLSELIAESGANVDVSIATNNSSTWLYLLITFGPLIIFFLVGWWLNRKMKKAMGDDNPSMDFSSGFGGLGGGGLGKSGARIVASKDVGVTFKDVAGQEEAKESLKEVVDFLEKPERYEAIGAKLPRGVLLVGPPGTGKTLIAKAVAGEAGVPFFSISGSEFVEMFVGRGAAKVRDLFKQAKEKAPCIVFIDEIDTIGKKRDGGGFSGNDEREQTLNQLLTEMDGFDNKKGIVVVAATNRPDSLDPALLRPGRFDRRVPMELPDLVGRKAILEIHAKDVKTEPPIDLTAIARATPGASGADLANIINEGALRAVRLGRNRARQEDFEESVEVVIAGQQRKSTVLSDHEKQVVSYHEIGHRSRQPEGGRAGHQDHDRAAHERRARLHHAGRAGREVPDHQAGGARQARGVLRRTCRRGAHLRRDDHRCRQRHRAGHQARAQHDHAFRHVRRVRHDGTWYRPERVPQPGYLAHLRSRYRRAR